LTDNATPNNDFDRTWGILGRVWPRHGGSWPAVQQVVRHMP